MKLFTSATLIMLSLFLFPQTSHAHTTQDVLHHLERNSPKLHPIFAKSLAQEIRRAADTYKVPHRILIAILAQESSYRLSVIGKTCNKKGKCRRDFGIGQISEPTAKFYGFNTERLTSDLPYSVHASAQVLSWFQKTYAHKEPKKWWTRYNCGTRRSVERNTCKTYHKAVQRWF